MKVTVENKKGLNKDLKILIDKETMSSYMDAKYEEIKGTVNLKGFRPGKVPKEVLKDTSTKALEENKIKPAGQPKLDLKTYGEDKELEYVLSVTEITYSSSLSSPYVFRSNFGCPAGLISFSSKALVEVSFITLSKTSLKTAFPNCLFRISLGTLPGLKPLRFIVPFISSYFSSM